MTSREQKPVTFYLEEHDYDWVNQDSDQLHLSRSAYLRNVVGWWRAERESGRMDEARAVLSPGMSLDVEVQGNGASEELAAANEQIRELAKQVEERDQLSRQLAESQARVLVLEGDVKTLTAEKEGLGSLIEHQRERQGMSDSLNQELTKTIDRITLMLPPAQERAESRGFNWRFWQR